MFAKFGKDLVSRDLIEAVKKVMDQPDEDKDDQTEELKGGQVKLDKNHNGKLDSQDFKMLRGEKKGVAEGYILKKTNVSKYMKPGDPDEYTQDVNVKDTDYEIINNKTGQVVGTASWTTNDFFGPGALKITMKNGATRWLDIWEREKGNPQSAFNRFVKDPKTAKKYKDEQGVAEAKKGSKPDFLDMDGDRKEPMKKALADKSKKKVSEADLDEKAVSQQQQKFMGMVHAMQKGERIKGASPELKKVARSMSQKDVRDYAATKHKGLPKKVGESESFKKKVTNQ